MKTKAAFVCIIATFLSCGVDKNESAQKPAAIPIVGTWRLLRGTLIEKGDTTITDYTKNVSFIKIINESHFAFLQHDVNKGKDSAVFVAGGGAYSIKDSLYTEHLQYCSDRQWEGTDFTFIVTIRNDTLIQRGVEKVEAAGVNRINIEMYKKVRQ